jgi:Fe-S oxidoreductase
MSLQDYEFNMRRCTRCSYCKFIPVLKQDNRAYEICCPSIARYNFHAYAGSGKLIVAQALVQGRVDYSDGLLDVIYRCNADGACDISCKNQSDLEVLQVMLELRAKCVQDGQLLPEHMVVIDGLKKEDNMMMKPKAERGNWAKGLGVKDLTTEKAEVLFHVGCRYSFDEGLWPIARSAIKLLKKAGVDVGVMGASETCCGGRAYEWGYQGEHTKYAEHNVDNWKTAGVKTIVTPCADCYHAFKVLYDKIGKKPDIEILHTSEYFARLVREGKLNLTRKVPETVTYHDPCHLGRLGEPWIHWDGIETTVTEGGLAGLVIQEPPKQFRRGANGVYDAPREVIRSIPGIKFVEMERIREYAWCCGAGGGVLEAYPEFADWTAAQRIDEAKAAGADAIVTACPWCERVFTDAIAKNGDSMKVYDIMELIEQATDKEG